MSQAVARSCKHDEEVCTVPQMPNLPAIELSDFELQQMK
jgi:hypothetical protein